MKVLNATGHLISGLPKLLFQNEAKCEAIDMKMIFHSHANKSHYRTLPCFESEAFWSRKWPI